MVPSENILFRRTWHFCNRSLTCLFQEIRCDIDTHHLGPFARGRHCYVAGSTGSVEHLHSEAFDKRLSFDVSPLSAQLSSGMPRGATAALSGSQSTR
jgi:hypothetical protein